MWLFVDLIFDEIYKGVKISSNTKMKMKILTGNALNVTEEYVFVNLLPIVSKISNSNLIWVLPLEELCFAANGLTRSSL